ncbi:MAG: phage terminase large subunit [Candidatus Bathyarchaeia archaeon]|jgi:predicted phage terminase large subunit-like protein
MKGFKPFEKRLDALEREIGEANANFQRKLSDEEFRGSTQNNANCIVDEESFRRWFRTYMLAHEKQDPQFALDEEAMWKKYEKTVLDNPYIKWKPQLTEDGRSPQAEFLICEDQEVFYGGACGGGKSVALLAAALQYVGQPGYDALLLRRRITDLSLPGSLMDLAHQWLDGTRARFDSKNGTFVFPSGSRIVFGYCENMGDEQRYRSAQFQYIGVDELTQWDEKQYLFLFSRLRKPKNLNVPLRMRSASNPGDVGHGWVKQRFVGEAMDVDGRVFIPAKLCDNPMLDQEGYMKNLMKLDPVTRAQILNGDWEINPEGCKFQRGWFQIVDDYPVGYRIVRYWDKASTEPKKGKDPDWTVGVKATMAKGVFCVLDVVRFRGKPQLNESSIRQVAEIDGEGVDIFMEQEPGSAGVNDIDNYARRVLLGFSFRGVKVTGSKELRANPLSSHAEQGNVKLVKGLWNRDFLEEFELFPYGAHDDIVDATSGAFSKLTENVPLGGGGVPSMFGN